MPQLRSLLTLLFLPVALEAEPLSATLVTAQDQAMSGSILAADATGITFAPSSGGGQVNQPYTNIKALSIQEPKDWPSAMAALQAGDLASADKQFGTLASGLVSVRALRDSYGSQAVFYRLLALRGAGRFKDLATELTLLKNNPLALGDLYQDELLELEAWAALSFDDVKTATTYLRPFEDTASQDKLPLPPFKPMRPARMASLACLRGLVLEHDKKPDLALLDYHRALTLGFGADKGIATLALTHALDLLSAQLAKQPDHPTAKTEAKALATLYRDLLAKGQLPAKWTALLGK